MRLSDFILKCYLLGSWTDNKIIIEIFTNPAKYDAFELVELIRSHDTILIGDRGFDGFKEWIKSNELFRSVEVKLPANKVIDTKLKQYPRKEVNDSRTYVTATRYIVECVHGAQKKYKLLSGELTFDFAKRHFLKVHMIINSFLNCFGINKRSLGTNRTFTDLERYLQLTKNNLIIESDLYKLITQVDNDDKFHDLHWKKRSKNIWSEIIHDQSILRGAFFRLNIKQIQSLTGGPFLHRKAKGYKRNQMNLFEQRKEWRLSQLEDSFATIDTITRPTMSYKIEKLNNIYLNKYFSNIGLTSLFRFDINSYFAKSHKFKTYIGIKNHPSNPKLTFGCTCSTGTRLTPCVHSILVLSMFANNSC